MLGYELPPPDNVLRLSVARLAGRTGRLVAYWEANPLTADLNDFSPISGNITFQDEQVHKKNWCKINCMWNMDVLYLKCQFTTCVSRVKLTL